MNVIVLGAGAVGSLFGAKLARTGHAVTLVGRPAHVAAVRAHGLRVRNDHEEVVRLAAEIALGTGTQADAALVTVKSFDLAAAMQELAVAVVKPIPTLMPQNGIGIEVRAEAALRRGGWSDPRPWMVRAVHSVPVTWLGPGVVREAGTGEILLALPNGQGPSDACIRLFEQLLRGAGFRVRLSPQFDRDVWKKLLVNATINPLTAVRGVPNGALLEGELHEAALRLLREARSAARAAGFDFGEEEAVREFERVARATAENRSSMLQDLDRGRPTEIDAISGELLRVAAQHGLTLPATSTIVEEVERRTSRRAGPPQP